LFELEKTGAPALASGYPPRANSDFKFIAITGFTTPCRVYIALQGKIRVEAPGRPGILQVIGMEKSNAVTLGTTPLAAATVT
jgi:hypothetical protein